MIEKPKLKSEIAKETFPYGWFRNGQINMCKILMHNGARQTKCVNKDGKCEGCLIIESYTPMLMDWNWKQIKQMSDGKLPKGILD